MDISLLLVDDETAITQALQRVFRRAGYTVRQANDAEQALEMMQQAPADIVVTDQRMPCMKGAELLYNIKRDHPETLGILLSGYCDFPALTDAVNEAGIFRFLLKPWTNDSILQEVRQAAKIIKQRRQQQQMYQLLNSYCPPFLLIDPESSRIMDHSQSWLEHYTCVLPELKNQPVANIMQLPEEQSLDHIYQCSQSANGWHGQAVLQTTGEHIMLTAERAAPAALVLKAQPNTTQYTYR